MKVEKAVVDYRYETGQIDYRITVYIGLQADSGPDFQVLITSIQQLYRVFMTYSKSESYRMAEFCLNNGYFVLAQRVNRISGRSSCRKFLLNTETVPISYFFSPREYDSSGGEMDYSINKNITIKSGFNTSQGEINPLCSVIVRYTDENFENQEVNSNFKLMVPILIVGEDGRSRFGMKWLCGCDVDISTLEPDAYKLTEPLLFNNLHKTLNDFFINQCGFEVEDTEEGYSYVRSDTMIQCFVPTDLTINNGTRNVDLIEVTPSDIGMNDNYCYLYNDYKVCTIYSKYDSCIDDMRVSIIRSAGYYYVTVYKINVDGAVIYTENFNYSSDPASIDFLTNLNKDSSLVEIEIYNEEADLSGTYDLKGRTNLSTDSDYVDSVTPTEDEAFEQSYNADICLDMSNGSDDYIKLLKNNFPNSLIFTDNDQLQTKFRTNVVTINPDVIWNDTKEKMKGFSLLLYMVRTDSNMSSSSLVKLVDTTATFNNSFLITKDDYDVYLMGVNSTVSDNSSNFPIRTALAILSAENLIVSSSFQNESEFIEVVKQAQKSINNYLSMNIQVEPVNISIVGSRLKAILNFYVDNMIISSYRIVATILE